MSLYNEDELNAPKFLNQEFFEKVLSEHEKDYDIEVVTFDLKPATMKGDHYASVMFRAKVEYRSSKNGPTATKSLIVKTMPDEEGMKREMLMQAKLFETEILMYAETLPAIEKILAQHGDNTIMAPKIIYHALEPSKVIILEDLCELGYTTIRGRYLHEEEVKAVYSKLAKLHAVSYMLGKSEQHEMVTKYQDGIFSNLFVLSNEMIAGGITKFIDMLSTHDDFDEYIPKFKALEKDLFTSCVDLFRAYLNGAKNEIFVLNHGDFHLKNLMVKFNEKTEMEELIMVDYQICVFAPSIIDLFYSTFMMLSPELRAKRNELMHYYFDQFIATLELIKYDGEMPKFADLQIAAVRYRHFAVFLLATFLPMIFSMLTMNPEDMKDTDQTKLFENGDLFTMFYRNAGFIAEVKRLLPSFLHAGYLD